MLEGQSISEQLKEYHTGNQQKKELDGDQAKMVIWYRRRFKSYESKSMENIK